MRGWVGNRVLQLYGAGLGLAAFWGVAGCTRSHEPAQVPPTPLPASVAATANVPALLGVSIDSLRSRLGPAQALPPNFEDPSAITTDVLHPADSLVAFRIGSLTVVASYNAHTRQVRDLLVLGQQEASIMARASLQANARSYLIMPVFFASRPGHLLGLRIINIKK
jgi:hypothetical protein